MADSQPGLLQELQRRKVYRVAIAYVVVSWVALQFFDLVLENVNAPDWVMQTVMALFAVGFPVAVVLAWAFDIKRDGAEATPAGNRAFAVLVVLISIGAIAFAGWLFTRGGDSAGTEVVAGDSEEYRVVDSIAVLPFESFSENRSDEYFADGLADTLLHKLARLPDLKVIARNSSFQFKGTNKDAREIGEILDVGALLEGSVQRQGNDVRIIAQLIDTVDGSHIWSATFDDSMQNIFELQDRIATEIMQQLQVSIAEQESIRTMRYGTDSPEAFELLLRARGLGWDLGRQPFDPETNPVLEMVDRALEIDPDYAPALATRSAFFSGALFFDDNPTRTQEFIDTAREDAERAIAADPEYPGGYVVLGMSYFRATDYPKAKEHLIRALQLDPNNDEAMGFLGLVTLDEDPQAALDLFERKRELDPESEFVYRQIFFAKSRLGRFDEAVSSLLEGVERFPENTVLKSDVANVYMGAYGQQDEGARWVAKILETDPQSRAGAGNMAGIWFAVGDLERASQWGASSAERFPDSPGVVAREFEMLMQTGNAQAARELVEGIPESPTFRFDRSVRAGGACLVLGDGDCMIEHADNMQRWLDERAARGQAYSPAIRYGIAAAVLRNAAIDDVAERDTESLEALLQQIADWPILETRRSRYAGYLRVLLNSLLGDDEAAVRELHKTLELEGDGFAYRDIFRITPERQPLILRLEGQPGYADWLTAFNGRREAVRGRLLQMERDGELPLASDVAR